MEARREGPREAPREGPRAAPREAPREGPREARREGVPGGGLKPPHPKCLHTKSLIINLQPKQRNADASSTS